MVLVRGFGRLGFIVEYDHASGAIADALDLEVTDTVTTRYVDVRDPDGNRIQIVTPKFAKRQRQTWAPERQRRWASGSRDETEADPEVRLYDRRFI